MTTPPGFVVAEERERSKGEPLDPCGESTERRSGEVKVVTRGAEEEDGKEGPFSSAVWRGERRV